MMCDNPKNAAGRLATAVYYPHMVSRRTAGMFGVWVQNMCDRPASLASTIELPHQVVEGARLYKHIFRAQTVGSSPVTDALIVDEWDAAFTEQNPIASVYCSTMALLRWTDAMQVTGDVIDAGRRELHAHVLRMDAYLKAQRDEDDAQHEFSLESAS